MKHTLGVLLSIFVFTACGNGLPERGELPVNQADSDMNKNPVDSEPVDVPPQEEVPTRASFSWKGVIMTGDASINVFDNARKTIKNLWLDFGMENEKIKELSWNPASGGNPIKSSVANFEKTMKELQLKDNEGCLVYLTSHGTKTGFWYADNTYLTPTKMGQILNETCGKRPTVLIVSACYSGVFVSSAVTAPNRVILTAARNDRTSFGCGAEFTYTYYDDCTIKAFNKDITWEEFYSDVKACVTRKEGNEFTPSLPQGYFGSEMQNKKLFATEI